jgi:hypothetical protein
MLTGTERVRLATAITTGKRMPEVKYMTSLMSCTPCEQLAVKARAPTADAPAQAERAECSDSTLTIRASS